MGKAAGQFKKKNFFFFHKFYFFQSCSTRRHRRFTKFSNESFGCNAKSPWWIAFARTSTGCRCLGRFWWRCWLAMKDLFDPLYLVMGRWVPEIRFLFSDIVHAFYAYPTLNDWNKEEKTFVRFICDVQSVSTRIDFGYPIPRMDLLPSLK